MTDLTSEEIKELWEISGEKMKLISNEEILKAHEGEKCRDCGESIAAAQLAADKAEMKALFEELEQPCLHPDCQTEKLARECGISIRALKAKYLGE